MKIHRVIVDLYTENDDQTDDLDILEILAAWHKRGMDIDQAEFGNRWPISIMLEHRSVRYSRTLPQEAIDERWTQDLPRGDGPSYDHIPHGGGTEGVRSGHGVTERLRNLFIRGYARGIRPAIGVAGSDDVITCRRQPEEHMFNMSQPGGFPIRCLCGKTEIYLPPDNSLTDGPLMRPVEPVPVKEA